MNKQVRAELFLFGTTFIWGSTFVIVKLGLEDLSPLLLIATRFAIASLLFLPFCWQPLFQMDRALFLNGSWLGFLIFLGFVAQTVSLQYTSASKSAFITSMMVIFTPIFQRIILRRSLETGNLLGIGVVCTGLLLLTAPVGTGFNRGDGLTLLCALVFGLYLVELDRISRQHGLAPLVFLQMSSCAVYAMIAIGPFESVVFKPTENALWGLAFLSILATLGTTYIQTRYQRDTTPTRAAIIFTIEPVWAAILGYLVLNEQMGLLGMLGGALILAGILVSELFDLARQQGNVRRGKRLG